MGKQEAKLKLQPFDTDYFYQIGGTWKALNKKHLTNIHYYTVFRHKTKIGIVGLFDVKCSRFVQDKHMIHYIVDERYRGRGYAQQFVKLIKRKEHAPYIIFIIDKTNTPSIKAAEKLRGIKKIYDEKDYSKIIYKYH